MAAIVRTLRLNRRTRNIDGLDYEIHTRAPSQPALASCVPVGPRVAQILRQPSFFLTSRAGTRPQPLVGQRAETLAKVTAFVRTRQHYSILGEER